MEEVEELIIKRRDGLRIKFADKSQVVHKGLKEFDIDGKKVLAINIKNATRKANKKL